MIEKVYLKDLNKVSDVTHVLGIDVSGNPVLIGKSNLAETIAPFVPATKGEVWIAYLDANNNIILIPWQNWSTTRTDAIGVAIISSGKRLLIAPHETSLRWSSTSGISGAFIATSKNAADLDFAGQNNTGKIITSDAFKNDGIGYAPGYCAAYKLGGVTSGSWWLPSLGELGLIYKEFNAINAALARINGSSLLNLATYWSSTERSSADVWVMSFTSSLRWITHKYDVNCRIRPVTSF